MPAPHPQQHSPEPAVTGTATSDSKRRRLLIWFVVVAIAVIVLFGVQEAIKRRRLPVRAGTDVAEGAAETAARVIIAAPEGAAKLQTEDGVRADPHQDVEDRRRQAGEQAALIVRDAEGRAPGVGETAGDRDRVLISDIEAAESRLAELATRMRHVVVTLDEVVADGRGERDAEETLPAKSFEEVSSLEAALRPESPSETATG